MITVTDVDLLQTLKNGSKSARKNHKSLPILAGVFIRQRGDRLEIISTDLETVSRDTVMASGVTDWGDGFVIPDSNGDHGNYGHTYYRWENPLTAWLKALEPDKRHPQTLELETYPHTCKLTVKAGNIRATFLGMDGADYPAVVVNHLAHYESPVVRLPYDQIVRADSTNVP